MTINCPRSVFRPIQWGLILTISLIASQGPPDSLCADEDCVDYRAGCMSDVDLCVSLEEPCGEAAGEECTDLGTTSCDAGSLWNCPVNLPYALICGFDHGGGGGIH